MIPENPSVCYRCKRCKLCFFTLPDIYRHLDEKDHYIRIPTLLTTISPAKENISRSTSTIQSETFSPEKDEIDLTPGSDSNYDEDTKTESVCNEGERGRHSPNFSNVTSTTRDDVIEEMEIDVDSLTSSFSSQKSKSETTRLEIVTNMTTLQDASTIQRGDNLEISYERAVTTMEDEGVEGDNNVPVIDSECAAKAISAVIENDEVEQNTILEKSSSRISNGTKERYRCKECDELFSSPVKVRIHMKKAHAIREPSFLSRVKKGLRSVINRAKRRSPGGVNAKRMDDNGKKKQRPIKFVCKYCPAKFTISNSIKVHVYLHHSETAKKPTEIKYRLKASPSTPEHKKLRRNGDSRSSPKGLNVTSPSRKLRQCPKCGRAFKHWGNVTNHLRACNVNKDNISDNEKLGKEEESRSVPVVNLQCPKCNKQYKNPYFFSNHKCNVGSNIATNGDPDVVERQTDNGKTEDKFHEKPVVGRFETEEYRTCWICGFVVTRFHNLKNHLEAKHKLETTYADIHAKKSELLKSRK